MLPLREQTPQGADRRVRGIARGNARPLYCDAMTDPNPDERPSFLARLAIVATIGIVILQIGLGVAGGMDAKRGVAVDTEDWILVVLFPAVSFFAIACLYYLFKGKPTNAEAFLAEQLTTVWLWSLFLGAIYCFLI